MKLLSIGDQFLSSIAQPVSSWHVLLGILLSLTPLIPGGHLCMQSLPLLLHHSCDRVDDSALVRWDVFCRQNLEWWLVRLRLESDISLGQLYPDLDFWSDTSDMGWGAHLADEVLGSGGDSSCFVRPPVWVRWVAPLPHLLLFRAFCLHLLELLSSSLLHILPNRMMIFRLAAAITVGNCRHPLVVSFVSPVSFLATVHNS